MAIDTTPQGLASAAACFDCLTPSQKDSIKTYALALKAGLNPDPQVLAAAAACFDCLTPSQKKSVQLWLMSGMATTPLSWTPASVNLNRAMGYSITGGAEGLQTLQFNESEIYSLYCEVSTLKTASFPNLTSVTGSSGMQFQLCSAMTSFSAPLLTTCTAYISFTFNGNLLSIALPSLTTTRDFQMNSCGKIVSVDLPSLVTASGTLEFNGNAKLTTISLPQWVPTNTKNYSFASCALTAATVNHILARCVANAAYLTGLIALNGGTNAAPTGQGLTDKATLIARGHTVNTN